MYQIGLKIWSTNINSLLYEAERLYAEGVFSYIELYVVPGSLKCLPAWKRLNIPFIIHNAHFMQHFNLAAREYTDSNRKIYEETKRFADELNVPYIIFHGGIDGNIWETAHQLATFHEPRALIENKPFRALPNHMEGQFCRGYNITELKDVMRVTNCGFCLDFGHAVCAANSLQREPYSYIKELTALKPVMYHLTDVNDMKSEYDSHPHLGKGHLNLAKILSLIPIDSRITVETQKDLKNSLDDFVSDISVIKFYDLECIPAVLEDAECIFKLSNDPLVRKNSFCSDEISWDTHWKWLGKKLQQENSFFYLIRNRLGALVAQIRFEPDENNYYHVSFSVSKAFRGKSFSSHILQCAISKLKKEQGNVKLRASIKNENIASLKCFLHAGFISSHIDTEKAELTYEI